MSFIVLLVSNLSWADRRNLDVMHTNELNQFALIYSMLIINLFLDKK